MTHENTKAVRSAFAIYAVSQNHTLNDAYKNPSCYKQSAYTDCLRFMELLNGYNFRIIGFNTSCFSCGFVYVDKDTNRHAFCYITPTRKRFVYLDEIYTDVK